jgi:hypothetical protein
MTPHYRKEIARLASEALFAHSAFSLLSALRNLKAIRRSRLSQEIERSHARSQILTQDRYEDRRGRRRLPLPIARPHHPAWTFEIAYRLRQ